MTANNCYLSIDYSSAKIPNDSLGGLRAFLAQGDTPAQEVRQVQDDFPELTDYCPNFRRTALPC